MSESSQESVVFDRAADYYDATRGFPPGEEVGAAAAMARAGKLSHGSRVLEIGIGTGRIALPLAAHVGQVAGVDLSRRMLARLREKRQNERVDVAEADATRLPFATATFDAVVGVHIFHLIAAWRVALAEAARVLKPGGVLLLGAEGRSASALFWEALNRAAPARTTIGVRHDQEKTFAEDSGWQLVHEAAHAYTVQRVPQAFIDGLRARIFSSTWAMTDAEIEVGAEAVRTAALERFGALDQPIDIDTSFEVRAYRPPAGG